MRRSWRRFAFAAALLAAVGVLSFAGKTLDAGVVGSPHDFSGLPGVAPSGTCSACHVPHGADPNAPLWARNLSLYVSRLTMNGDVSGKPNYILSPTLACYDCHDDHSSSTIDDNPLFSAFSSGYKPQDIAFGGDGPGGTKAGYYEHNPPNQSGGSYGVFSYPGQFTPANPDNLAKTGGHYFKTDPTASGRPDIGDKLPCRDCHDPHSSLQAFIRTNIPYSGANPGLGSSYSSVMASTEMTNNSGRTRSDEESRKICVQCHSYSNNGTPVKFNQISSAYTNGSDNVPKPPGTIPDHNSGAGTACVSCHKHNAISIACYSCHSYPGQDNAASQKQMSRGHWPHVGKPGAGGTDNSMRYACEVCHYNYNHNGSNNFAGSWWTFVDVQFGPTLNPAFSIGGPTYGGQPAYGGTFAAGIGVAEGNPGNTTCAGLYCHGDNPEKNLVWEGAAKTPAWTGTVACGACHKADSTFRQGNHAVHIDNTGANARGPGGVAVFSPAGNCSDGTATGCHTAYALNPTTTHARGTATFRTSPASGVATDNANTQVCNACHSTYAVAYFDNTLISNTRTGVQLAKENWKDNTYRLPCLTCHNNSGRSAGSTANARMDGTGAWAPGIEKYWRASGHGYPSGAPVDNTDSANTGTSLNTYKDLPLRCVTCHNADGLHFGNTPAGNAWRLVSWSGYDNTSGEGLDQFCALQCHGGAVAGTSWDCAKPGIPADHFWIGGCSKDPTDTHASSRPVIWAPESIDKTKDPNSPTLNYMPLGSDIRSEWGAIFLCVTCHDPHGTGPDAVLDWGRSFAGANSLPVDHMLRYEHTKDLCLKCHL